MDEIAITEKILLDTVARFESANSGNAAAAKLLREGIAGGKLQDSDWIAKILLNTNDGILTEESVNEASTS